MSSNNGGTPPSLEGITSQLQAALEAVRGREADARLVLTGIEGERRKLEKMIELATGSTQRTRPATSKRGSGGTGSKPERVAAFREEARRRALDLAMQVEPVLGDVDHSFTIRSLREAGYPHSEETLRRAVDELRDVSLVRLVGQHQLSGTGKGSAVYALTNAQGERQPVMSGADVTDG